MTPDRVSVAAAYVSASRQCSEAADRVETRRRLVARGRLDRAAAVEEDLGELATALRLWSGMFAMEVARLSGSERSSLWARLRWLLLGR